jgi:hypothetical protein
MRHNTAEKKMSGTSGTKSLIPRDKQYRRHDPDPDPFQNRSDDAKIKEQEGEKYPLSDRFELDGVLN